MQPDISKRDDASVDELEISYARFRVIDLSKLDVRIVQGPEGPSARLAAVESTHQDDHTA